MTNTTNTSTNTSTGMAFYHPDGFVPAWKHATAYINNNGRVATLPDIIDARLAATSPDVRQLFPWDAYFTTNSAEYLGRSRGGNRIIIVAHGIGPMSNLDGIVKAYGHEFKDKQRNKRGGRISAAEFLKLESGHYGDVNIVDYEAIVDRYEYPFMEILTFIQAYNEPLLKARLGERWAHYLRKHAVSAIAWKVARTKRRPTDCSELNPYILRMEDASNCSYMHHKLEDGEVFAHLLSIGGLVNVSHRDSANEGHDSLVSDISCHEWWNGVRLAAVRGSGQLIDISSGSNNVPQLMQRHWQHLLKPVSEPTPVGFRSLVTVGDHWFTEYQKHGESMDTGEPEFLVTKITSISGGPETFTTTEGGGIFFRYGIKEVERIAPNGANAYYLPADVSRGGLGFITPIQFFNVEVDASRRLPKQSEVNSDFKQLMELIERDRIAA